MKIDASRVLLRDEASSAARAEKMRASILRADDRITLSPLLLQRGRAKPSFRIFKERCARKQ